MRGVSGLASGYRTQIDHTWGTLGAYCPAKTLVAISHCARDPAHNLQLQRDLQHCKGR
jgi:hypothetical protein